VFREPRTAAPDKSRLEGVINLCNRRCALPTDIWWPRV